MSTVELRNKIQERLETIEEYSLLEEILNLIELETSKDSMVFIIPEEHKRDLEISIAQKKDGQTIPNDVVKERVQKWHYR